MQNRYSSQHRSRNKGARTRHPAGLVHNTIVLAHRGRMRVQDLRPGDRLITPDGPPAALQHIETISLLTPAVYVIAGSLGHHRGDEDTLLSAGQPVLLRDWRARAFGGCCEIVRPAGDLTDGEFVRDLGWLPMTLYQIRCDRPAVICAGGIELGTSDYDQARPRPSPV